jgi:23S rRNA pseudouridine2605 synthase
LEGHPAGFSADLGPFPRERLPNPGRSRNEFLLTSEQLLATRAKLWRQRAEPLLTLDDALSWMSQTGLCLFLPRKTQIPAPAPSFVEACLGETNPTPPRTAIESARNLLARLIEANSALPLNLLGTSNDHPDFLVNTEALPFVYALRGDRDWKYAPGTRGANRVSPLITHVWQLLQRRGVLTTGEIQEGLGKELTEAAVIRALHELWASLRVVPLYQAEAQETLWEPLQSRHQKAITTGVSMSQVTALSVLASVYLQSVVAASGDDAESFLSPLASRSKVREVIRGLTATRQLSLIQMETQSLLYVEGSLPEFPEAEKPAPVAEPVAKPAIRRPHPTSPQAMEATLRRNVSNSTARPAYKRPAAAASGGFEKRSSRPPQRTGGASFRPAPGARPDPRKRESGSYRPSAGSAAPFKPRTSPVERPVVRSEPGTGLRPDGSPKKTRWRDLPGGRPDQKGKPARFGPRKTEGAGERQSSHPVSRREPGSFRPAPGSKPAFDRNRPAAGRSASARPPFRPSGGRPTSAGARPPSRTGAPRFGAGGFSSARPRTGESRPYSPRPGRPSGPPTGAGRPSSPRPAGATFKRTGAGPGFKPRGGKPGGSGSRPGGRSAGGPPNRGPRPGFGQGPRPGGAKFKAGSGRPRPASGAKPGSRPPAKFKKRPERGE